MEWNVKRWDSFASCHWEWNTLRGATGEGVRSFPWNETTPEDLDLPETIYSQPARTSKLSLCVKEVSKETHLRQFRTMSSRRILGCIYTSPGRTMFHVGQ